MGVRTPFDKLRKGVSGWRPVGRPCADFGAVPGRVWDYGFTMLPSARRTVSHAPP